MSEVADLLKPLKHFVTRDVVYISGGFVVSSAFLYGFQKLPEGEISNFALTLWVVISYPIGFGLQELFSKTPFLTTGREAFLEGEGQSWYWSKIFKYSYEWHMKRKWEPLEPDKFRSAYDTFIAKSEDSRYSRHFDEYQRIMFLLHVLTVFGPCLLVSGIFVVCKWYCQNNSIDFFAGISLFCLGLFFIVQSWAQGGVACQHVNRHGHRWTIDEIRGQERTQKELAKRNRRRQIEKRKKKQE